MEKTELEKLIEEQKKVKCPRCLSTEITANRKGFSGTKAVAGGLLLGGVGLLAGTIGSNKVKLTCLKCGYEFNPGDRPLMPPKHYSDLTWLIVGIILVVAITLTIILATLNS